MSFAHIGFAVHNLEKSKEFYSKALAPLGPILQSEKTDSFHFGKSDGRTMLWLHTRGTPPGAIHLSFEAGTKEQVQEFYAAAISAGGKDNGAPGIRADYAPTYYAAFVFDPDGHNIEVICRK